MSAEESQQQEGISRVVLDLVSSLRTMFAKGIEPNYKNLQNASPHHSSRDYSAALRLYRDELDREGKWAETLPEEVADEGRSLAMQAWSLAREHFSAQLQNEKLKFNLELDECRAARQHSEEQVLALGSENERLKSAEEELCEDNCELKRTVQELEKDKTTRDVAIIKLQTENGLLKEQITKLYQLLKGQQSDALQEEGATKQNSEAGEADGNGVGQGASSSAATGGEYSEVEGIDRAG